MLERRLPEYAAPPAGPLTAQALFGDDRPLWLEIGFGRGEHLAWQAGANPGIGLIGAEPFRDGVVGALLHIERGHLANVRLHHGDALDLLDRLPNGSLQRVFLLHPDPWPKSRHAKRRFINPGPLDLVAARLAPGGLFRIGTDDPTYLRWTLMQMAGRREFAWTARAPRDWRSAATDWPQTRYAAKALAAKRELWHLEFRRCP